MSNTRRTHLELKYENMDISADLQPDLKSWTYTDNLSGQADDIQITLVDTAHKWIGSWMPSTGAVLKGAIIRENFESEGKSDKLPLGQFEIDTVDFNFPPSEVTIKGISVPESSSLRGQAKSQAWEKTKLSVIAGDKAKKASLKLLFDVDENPEYDRIEQTEETDLSFIVRLCNDAGLCVKVTGTHLVILDEAKYERQTSITTINKNAAIKSFKGSTTSTGMYRSCRVEFHDPKKKKKIKAVFTPPNAPKTGRELFINQKVESIAEAMRLAKKKLREANKNAVKVSLSVVGDPLYVAGITLDLNDFGLFDGKYIVTQATHSQQSGYDTSLQLRRCLEGY
ncbi:phage late control D family protein [Brevibacillus porteri]|uniref:Phage late control D family protein n=1 Tax=Brevibacillus porteri TaxID=2126350 RepID=A0ABX5FFP9_9BACL|nr:contractile injection system protein, VgrG/Pvc8 family [Brevibacillus porteri]MED1803022.1 contractile injection system protein, VgrG/Pvc8 family [Brevibacillus porteri]MED2135130.1 contractile injection system protein, VgrG/Pvc8 family [Brevibacillus porteri]MED2745772.1 contractile injection system protein, VgrG/Pvc8 family [Brevibacillus porteri]MED2813764.1 contractile injection system protein, VgrG/Pvc8 family [Brevibacillus porteri]MED2897772.1 contractile injection system protein, Vg